MAKKKNTSAAAAAASKLRDDNRSVGTGVATAGDRTMSHTEQDDFDDDDQDDIVEVENEEFELLQVDLGDMVKVKQILDECVAAVVLEYLPENTTWDNYKLLIMFLACCFAVAAQFNTMSFPHNRYILGFCGIMYFVLSSLLQFITTFIDQDTIVWTDRITETNNVRDPAHMSLLGPNSYYSMYVMKHHQNAEPKQLQNPLFTQYGVRVRTSLPRFSEYYTVSLEFHTPKDSKGSSSDKNDAKQLRTMIVSQNWSIGRFFDQNGYFDEIGFAKEIELLLFQRMDQQQYDSDDVQKKND
jgi:signal peptidase complex subunit 2